MRFITILLGMFLCAFTAGCEGSGRIVDDDTVADDDDDDDVGDDDTSLPEVEDVFVQEADPTDVLFVVDNSCSMQEEQAALVTHFEPFLQRLVDVGIDYHIGITVLDDWATQPPIGQLYGSTRYIEPTTPDPVGSFTGNMTMGADGMGSCEVGMEATQRALSEPLVSEYNGGFYREEARLQVVVVSDEVDGSVYGCDAVNFNQFLPWFTGLKDEEESLFFAAIVGDAKTGCKSTWGAADPGEGYHDVVELLGEESAIAFSICEQDWTPAMDQLGQWAAQVPISFPLSAIPHLGALRVYLDLDGPAGPTAEVEIYADPTYEDTYAFVYDVSLNSLEFTQDTAPPHGAQLRVVYQAEGR